LSGVIGLLVLLAAGAGVYVSGIWRTWLGEDATSEFTSSDIPDESPEIVEDIPEPQIDVSDEPAVDEPPKARLAPIEEFRDSLKSGGSGPLMVALPAASFEMGAPSISTAFDERPRHEVSIPEFAISKTEVTIADYERFARATGRRLPHAGGVEKSRYPVSGVSWEDAVDYSRWLSQQTGQTYRLPSEAEWEFAATAGIDSPYPWGFNPGTGKAHCFSCGETLAPKGPTAIASFDPNAFGLHDVNGNVAEWVRDCFSENYEGAPTDGSAWEQGDCSTRVVRGGSFRSPPKSIRSRKREKLASDRRDPTVGIRLVRER
jgi:formylglycine-generating enzyme required for sulfatase activity